MSGVALTAVKGGINRQRVKGAALKDSLYDAVNCYVSSARTVVVRHGSRRIRNLPAITKGLVSFDGEIHVFSHLVVEVSVGVKLHVLTHPDSLGNTTDPIALLRIHFAEPMMGFLYVVAEFVTGDVFHYWLQAGDEWEANKVYRIGDIVVPSALNGISYQATRLNPPNPVWTPNIVRTVGDVVEPTTYNGYFFTVVDTLGANPVSGATEPPWVAEEGAQTVEDTEQGTGGSGGSSSPDVDTTPAPSTQDRYDRGTNT